MPGTRRIRVRRATLDDVGGLLGLWRELEAVQGSFRRYRAVADAAARIEASFRDAIASDDADVLLAEDGDEPVGMTLVRVERPSRMSDEPAAELSRVVVREDRRGEGIGHALVGAARGWARERGIGSLVAAIFVANEPSRRFWRAEGFEPWAERMVRSVE